MLESSPSFLVVACLALLSPFRGALSSSAQQRAFDEAAWTRATWEDFKLELPVRPSQPSDEARLEPVRALLEECDFATIDGPNQRSLVPLNRRIPSITVHKESQRKAVLAEVITKDHQVKPASLGIKCSVCNSMVEDIFQTVQHVADHDKILKEDGILELLKKSCDDKILYVVLDNSAVVAMDPDDEAAADSRQGGKQSPPPPERRRTPASPVYQLQPRPASLSIQEKEIKAVTAACKGVLADLQKSIPGKLHKALLDLKQTKQQLLKSSTAEMCEDNNSQCSIWALRGECSKNPTYMLYHCKASCGVCQGPKTRHLKDAQTLAVKKLVSRTCGVLPECKGSGGSFHERVLSYEIKKEEDLSKKQSSPNLNSEKDNDKKDNGEYGDDDTYDNGDYTDEYYEDYAKEASSQGVLSPEDYIEQDLGDAKNKCVYLNQGWWTYQLCYKLSIRQLHLENRKVTTQHDLGVFNSMLTKAAEGKKNMLESEDLIATVPEHLPYVSHFFSGGSPCEKNSDTLRQSELRIACSMSGGLQMKIREPSKCSYILVLYTPSLCQHPDFAPVRAGGKRPKPVTS